MEIVRIALDISVVEADVDSAGWDLQWFLGKVIKAEGTTPKQAIFYEKDENGEKTFIRYTEDFHIEKVEERIIQARKTNIFGRKQSGENERQRDKLTQEIKDLKNKIAENESSIKALEE